MPEKLPNLSQLFYRNYYRDFDADGKPDAEHLERQNQVLFKARLKAYAPDALFEFQGPGFHHCDLEIAYPGLLTGSGLMHITGEEKEIKLGFALDHSSGLPYVAGSSVKGALRHYLTLLARAAHQDAPSVHGYLQAVPGLPLPEPARLKPWLEALIQQVFEGPDHPYRRDVFCDAYPRSSGNPNGVFLGSDYLTPHGKWNENPIPLQFMKLLPGVRMRFRFRLRKVLIEEIEVPAAAKLNLFEQLLADWGVGAKTQSGYGRMDIIRQQAERTAALAPETAAEAPPAGPPPEPVRSQAEPLPDRTTVEAQVLDNQQQWLTLRLLVQQRNTLRLPRPDAERYPVDTIVQLQAQTQPDGLTDWVLV